MDPRLLELRQPSWQGHPIGLIEDRARKDNEQSGTGPDRPDPTHLRD